MVCVFLTICGFQERDPAEAKIQGGFGEGRDEQVYWVAS